MCGKGGLGCGANVSSGAVGGCDSGSDGSGSSGDGADSGGNEIAARGSHGIWMQYFSLEGLNSPHGGGDV